MKSPLINSKQLLELLEDDSLVLLDSSWHLPTAGREPLSEYHLEHIPKALFFDIDAISDKNSVLPHMLPPTSEFEKAVGELGISNSSTIVIYDSVGVTSSARGWWTFRIFGHQNVYVLNGGLTQWKAENNPVTSEVLDPVPGSYTATLDTELVVNRYDVEMNIQNNECIVLDARPYARFIGEIPEPRPGVEGGHIPMSKSLPFTELINGPVLRGPDEIIGILADHDVTEDMPVITSCGSGITAAIITLALEEAGFGMNKLYDGSWAEWGSIPETPKHID